MMTAFTASSLNSGENFRSILEARALTFSLNVILVDLQSEKFGAPRSMMGAARGCCCATSCRGGLGGDYPSGADPESGDDPSGDDPSAPPARWWPPMGGVRGDDFWFGAERASAGAVC